MNQTKALIAELQRFGITNSKVLKAFEIVPRDAFTRSTDVSHAYANIALPISCEQTISQPYIVALMTQSLFLHPQPQKILEVGTGSGYQSAILSVLFKEIYSIERIKPLHETAKEILAKLNYTNVRCQWGDGFQGWAEHAPYDGILVTACAPSIPTSLFDQLSPNGGIMVIPLQNDSGIQQLTLIKKQDDKIASSNLEFVSFVPLLKGTSDPRT